MASGRHREFANFRFFLSSDHPRNGNSHPLTKYDRNRIIHGWDMDIKLFSKWRPSAILNFRKLPFWSRDLCMHVVLHISSKFRINRPIWRWGIAKNGFQYGVRPPSSICYDVLILRQKAAFYVLNFVLSFNDVRLPIFWNTFISYFSILAWNCLFLASFLTIFGENRQ